MLTQRKNTPLYISVDQKLRKGRCKTKSSAKILSPKVLQKLICTWQKVFRRYPIKKKGDQLERKYYIRLSQT